MTSMNVLGEKAFLRGLLPQLRQDGVFVNGFGHDASILDLGLEQHVAFKIDRAPTPVSIRRGWSDYKPWGRLAVTANVSDLLAAAATPRAMMLSVVAPPEFSAQALTDIVLGCQESCEQHGIAFVGGDTKEGPTVQVVGAAIGTVDKHYRLGRASAAVGDHLVMAGSLGAFAGALSLLDTASTRAWKREDLLRTLTMPMARTVEGAYLRECKLAIAACDLSDGLADALNVFCSDAVGITLDERSLPIHEYAVAAASVLGVPASRFAFGVGDWALALLVPHSSVELLLAGAPSDIELRDMGQFDDTGIRAIRLQDGTTEPTPSLINEQFRSRLEDDSGYIDSLLGRAGAGQ